MAGNDLRMTHVSNKKTDHIGFTIFAKNARSLKSDDDVQELLTELTDIKWDAVLVNETWREEAREMWQTAGGHTFIASGWQGNSRGVAILLHRS
eukprot:9819736-Karenia_brevis.AAC.1